MKRIATSIVIVSLSCWEAFIFLRLLPTLDTAVRREKIIFQLLNSIKFFFLWWSNVHYESGFIFFVLFLLTNLSVNVYELIFIWTSSSSSGKCFLRLWAFFSDWFWWSNFHCFEACFISSVKKRSGVNVEAVKRSTTRFDYVRLFSFLHDTRLLRNIPMIENFFPCG